MSAELKQCRGCGRPFNPAQMVHDETICGPCYNIGTPPERISKIIAKLECNNHAASTYVGKNYTKADLIAELKALRGEE